MDRLLAKTWYQKVVGIINAMSYGVTRKVGPLPGASRGKGAFMRIRLEAKGADELGAIPTAFAWTRFGQRIFDAE
jgi:hypothetical protein